MAHETVEVCRDGSGYDERRDRVDVVGNSGVICFCVDDLIIIDTIDLRCVKWLFNSAT